MQYHPVVTDAFKQISAHKRKRYALDGERYTLEQYVTAYGEDAGRRYWQKAPHYKDLPSFASECNLLSMRYIPKYGIDEKPCFSDLAMFACCGEFGIVFPDVFMLVPVRHLGARLKPSRLAPESDHWPIKEEVWDNGLVIGVGDSTSVRDFDRKTIKVADFREEAYQFHNLATLGISEMRAAASDFLRFLDDSKYKGLEKNPIMDFLCVVVSRTSGA